MCAGYTFLTLYGQETVKKYALLCSQFKLDLMDIAAHQHHHRMKMASDRNSPTIRLRPPIFYLMPITG